MLVGSLCPGEQEDMMDVVAVCGEAGQIGRPYGRKLTAVEIAAPAPGELPSGGPPSPRRDQPPPPPPFFFAAFLAAEEY
jgi:hypothetical protein